MGAHAKFSPSSSARWLSCTQSMLLPHTPQASSKYAERGTAIHSEAAFQLSKGKCEREKTKYKLTTDDIESFVKPYCDYVDGIDADIKLIESKVNIADECFGTADVIAYNSKTDHLHVIDLKAGLGIEVEVENNTQLLIYAIGAMNRMVVGLERTPRRVSVHIVQPAFGTYEYVDVPITELVSLRNKVLSTIKEVNDGIGRYDMSDSTCRWCPAILNCEEVNKNVIGRAQSDFADVQAVVKRKASEITAPTLAKWLDLLPLMKVVIKVTEEKALEALNAGVIIPGYGLEPKRATRKWVSNDAKTIKHLVEAHPDIKRADFYADKSLLSPAQAEKLVRSRGEVPDLSEFIFSESSGMNVKKEKANQLESAKQDFLNAKPLKGGTNGKSEESSKESSEESSKESD